MKRSKLMVFVLIVAVMLIGGGILTFAAANGKTPAEVVAGLTGKTTEQVLEARAAGKAFGAQALEAGKLEEFKNARQALAKERVQAAVDNGRLTQEQAEARIKAMEERMASCNGTGENMGKMSRGSTGLRDGNRTGNRTGDCTGTGTGAGGNAGSNGTGMRKGNGADTGTRAGQGANRNAAKTAPNA